MVIIVRAIAVIIIIGAPTISIGAIAIVIIVRARAVVIIIS